ncbi:unnamed protein product [Lactuca saligna]|uniref:K Homology domain-containing protein n=1 Tax=Lactuca saligna TaxID=75948 RepID=A0AA36E2J2_LACSI|nr:unnamed protein product [Lactuca saligna]
MSNSHETGTGTTKGTYTHHQSFVATSHYPSQHNTNLTQAMDNLKLSSSSIDRPLTPGKWHPLMGQDISTWSTSVGRSAAIVSNVSVEILVPQTVIALVYGENGSNLTRLRHISSAKVVVHEPRSGTNDHIVLISERAESLARAVSGEALPIEQLDAYCPENGIILANCSAIGMEPDVHLTPVSKENLRSYDLVFDAVYTPRNTHSYCKRL